MTSIKPSKNTLEAMKNLLDAGSPVGHRSVELNEDSYVKLHLGIYNDFLDRFEQAMSIYNERVRALAHVLHEIYPSDSYEVSTSGDMLMRLLIVGGNVTSADLDDAVELFGRIWPKSRALSYLDSLSGSLRISAHRHVESDLFSVVTIHDESRQAEFFDKDGFVKQRGALVGLRLVRVGEVRADPFSLYGMTREAMEAIVKHSSGLDQKMAQYESVDAYIRRDFVARICGKAFSPRESCLDRVFEPERASMELFDSIKSALGRPIAEQRDVRHVAIFGGWNAGSASLRSVLRAYGEWDFDINELNNSPDLAKSISSFIESLSEPKIVGVATFSDEVSDDLALEIGGAQGEPGGASPIEIQMSNPNEQDKALLVRWRATGGLNVEAIGIRVDSGQAKSTRQDNEHSGFRTYLIMSQSKNAQTCPIEEVE